MTRRPYVAGNWKMNLTAPEALRLASEVVRKTGRHRSVDVGIIPSYPYVMGIAQRLEGSATKLGVQDIDASGFGARTGAVNAVQAESAGAVLTLVGHSERRAIFGDDDAACRAKVEAALSAGLEVMLCVGETEMQRDQHQTQAVIEAQLSGGLMGVSDEHWSRISIAYEPVWAIGTGKTATTEDAQSMHASIRDVLAEMGAPANDMSVLYGGSVKADNAAALFAEPDVDGALVGGASLKAEEFFDICRAFPADH